MVKRIYRADEKTGMVGERGVSIMKVYFDRALEKTSAQFYSHSASVMYKIIQLCVRVQFILRGPHHHDHVHAVSNYSNDSKLGVNITFESDLNFIDF